MEEKYLSLFRALEREAVSSGFSIEAPKKQAPFPGYFFIKVSFCSIVCLIG